MGAQLKGEGTSMEPNIKYDKVLIPVIGCPLCRAVARHGLEIWPAESPEYSRHPRGSEVPLAKHTEPWASDPVMVGTSPHAQLSSLQGPEGTTGPHQLSLLTKPLPLLLHSSGD